MKRSQGEIAIKQHAERESGHIFVKLKTAVSASTIRVSTSFDSVVNEPINIHFCLI